MADDEVEVVIVLPEPHRVAQAATQLLLCRLRRAQAGPANTVGRTAKKEIVTAAIKDKAEMRAIWTNG